MRLIDADALCEGLVSNNPVAIAAKCAPTVDAVSRAQYDDLYAKYCELARLTNEEFPKLMGLIRDFNANYVEPVRHGRWEWRGGIPWCSNCGEMLNGYSYENNINTTPYCPNCGAKMGGVESEAD